MNGCLCTNVNKIEQMKVKYGLSVFPRPTRMKGFFLKCLVWLGLYCAHVKSRFILVNLLLLPPFGKLVKDTRFCYCCSGCLFEIVDNRLN